MQNLDVEPTVPWYQVKMVWLMLAIPALTVVGCMVTIFLAITHPDPVYSRSSPQHVSDDVGPQ